VRSAPGTHLWLLLLAIDTFILVGMSPRARHYFLTHTSTNLVELRHHPVKVLIASAFWTETPSFLLWFALFTLILAPVERWLGTARWLLVVASAHVLATLISETAVRVGIDSGELPHSIAHTVDIGVSYGLAGGAGVLAWKFTGWWRWTYLACALGYVTAMLVAGGTFTDLGHLTALLIGLSAYPFTIGRPRANPRWPRRLRREWS